LEGRAMNGKITLTGANLVFFVFAVLFVIFQFILIFLTAIYGGEFLYKNVYKILLINEYVLILIPVLVYSLIKKLDFKEVFRLNRLGFLPAVLIFLLSVPAYLVALMLNNAVIYLLQFLGDVPYQPMPVPQNPAELIVEIAIVAVSPAICEELLHRGILLRAYENRGSMKAVVITSIYFGIFHFDVTNLLGPIFLGLLIGYYVIRTNSIFAGVLAHFLNNAIAVLSQYFLRGTSQPDEVRISAGWMWEIILFGIVGLIIVAEFMHLFKLATEGKHELQPPVSGVGQDIVYIITQWPIIIIFALYMFITGLNLLTIIISNFIPG